MRQYLHKMFNVFRNAKNFWDIYLVQKGGGSYSLVHECIRKHRSMDFDETW